jgi:excisionase family DNA binding protein
MAEQAPEVTVVNAASWAARADQLAQLLGRSAEGAVIPDPGGQPADPSALAAITDPSFWSAEPAALADALRSPADIGGDRTRGDRSAGVITTGPDRLTLTVEEAAATLGVSRASAYEAVRRGEIPAIRIGRRVLVPRAALDRLLSAGPEGASSAAE